ncbi:MAG: hypothetical protein WB421_09910 [Terriglobales bacterium]
MSEETPSTPSSPSSTPPQTPLSFNIGEEYGTAAKNLPPVKIVLIAIGLVAVIAGVLIAFQEKTLATGTITNVESADVPGQNMVMVAINVSLHNRSGKPFRILSIQAQIDAGGNLLQDDAASASDVDRYLQGFPSLQQHALAPLARENTIAPNGDAQGTFVVTFPVTPEVFAARKSLKVTIQSYDRGVPVVLTK